MRVSVFFPYQVTELRQFRAVARLAERLGYDRVWCGNSLAIDTQIAMAAAAARFPRLGFGTAVSVMQFRHPLQTAIEARSLAAATEGRFALGLGVSERAVVEGMLGLPRARPLEYAREYVTVVKQALADGVVQYDGAHLHVHAELPPSVCGEQPPVLLGALAEPMARLAGEIADGAITWLAPASYVADVTVPSVRAGAELAGREPPRVVALVPCVATVDERLAREVGRFAIGTHVTRPHYARMLRSAGLVGGGEAVVTPELIDALVAWGEPDEVGARVDAYRIAGVDELGVAAYLFGDDPARLFERTLDSIAMVAAA